MEWNASTLWWLATGALVAAELASGTFYLLMLAVGTAAGALAAHAGTGSAVQIIVACLVGLAATVGWHGKRRRAGGAAAADAAGDPNVNIDIGQRVHVPGWLPDGSARVQYRGAAWSARFAGAGAPLPGEHVIVALDGNELRVAPVHR